MTWWEHAGYVHGTEPSPKESGKQRLYLSGKMSGIKGYNFPLFKRVAHLLRVKGYDIIDPTDKEESGEWRSRSVCILEDLRFIMDPDTDGVVAMDSAFASEGGCIEMEVCRQIGKPVFRLILINHNGFPLKAEDIILPEKIDIIPYVPSCLLKLSPWNRYVEEP